MLGLAVGAGVLVVALAVVGTLALSRSGHRQASPPPAKPTSTPTRLAPSLDDAAADPAPITLDTLLPPGQTLAGARRYTQRLSMASTDCAAAAGPAYASAMRTELCAQLLRATYSGPAGTDVTVGIAVFDSKAEVDHVVAALRHVGAFRDPFLLPMPAAGMAKFTVAAGPLSTARPVGRYLVLGVTAYDDGHAFTRSDNTANQVLADLLGTAEANLKARLPSPSPAVTVGG